MLILLMAEIPRPTTWDGAENLVNNGIFTISTGYIAGFQRSTVFRKYTFRTVDEKNPAPVDR